MFFEDETHKPNYYAILGVSYESTSDEIKRAYRSLQLKHHPDRNANCAEAVHITSSINEAYEVLSDPAQRAKYDAQVKISKMPGKTLFKFPPPAWKDDLRRHPPSVSPLYDMLNMIFNSSSAKLHTPFFHVSCEPMVEELDDLDLDMDTNRNVRTPHVMQRIGPITKHVKITMQEAYAGLIVPVEVKADVNACHDNSVSIINVPIPAGVHIGETIAQRVDVCSKSHQNMIQVVIDDVTNDTEFERNGNDLILTKTISLRDALCGGFSFNIKHPNGHDYTLKNERGSIIPPGFKRTYDGMGMKRGINVGCMIVIFNVQFPEQLSESQLDTLSTCLHPLNPPDKC